MARIEEGGRWRAGEGGGGRGQEEGRAAEAEGEEEHAAGSTETWWPVMAMVGSVSLSPLRGCNGGVGGLT